jgi:membrane protease YdiL (CAAX protease family)
MPTVFDHFLVLLFAVAEPVYSAAVWYPRMRPRLAAGAESVRARMYRYTMAEEWFFVMLVVLAWSNPDRRFADLGLATPGGWGFWVGAAFVLAAGGFLTWQTDRVRRSAELQAQVRKQFNDASAEMIPRDATERRWYVLLCLTAGFCEELLFRGYLILYLSAWMSVWGAATVSSALFGFAHAYLGVAGAVRAAGMGLVFAALYLISGTLWLPIVLHAVIDITSGLTGSAALTHPFREPAATG